MRSYVEFEICNGAYEVSCPDAKCSTSAALSIDEISKLVNSNLLDKHIKFRINHGELPTLIFIFVSFSKKLQFFDTDRLSV